MCFACRVQVILVRKKNNKSVGKLKEQRQNLKLETKAEFKTRNKIKILEYQNFVCK